MSDRHGEMLGILSSIKGRMLGKSKSERRVAQNAALRAAFSLPDDGTDYASQVYAEQMRRARAKVGKNESSRTFGDARLEEIRAERLQLDAEEKRLEAIKVRRAQLDEEERRVRDELPYIGIYVTVRRDGDGFRVREVRSRGGVTVWSSDNVREANKIAQRIDGIIERVLEEKNATLWVNEK